jgi:PAS domain S-box-containing protein
MAVFSDPDSAIAIPMHQHVAQLLRVLIFFCLLAVLVYTLASPIDRSLIPLRLVVVIPLIAAFLVALWLVRRQRLRQASWLLIGSLWVILTITATLSGGITAPAFAALPIVVVMSGVLLGRRWAWIIALLSIGVGSLFVLFAGRVLSPPFVHSPMSWLIAYGLYLLLGSYFIDQLVQHFHQSLRETEKELRERQATEQQLRVSEEKLARLFDFAPFAMIIVRLHDEVIINANAACREFFGVSSEQLIKQPISALHWSQLPSQWPTIAATLHQQGSVYGVEFSFQRRDNTTCFAQLAAEIVEMPEGLCAIVAMQDVTPLRRANERLVELAAHQEQLATLAREALANSNLDALFTVAAEQIGSTLPLSGIEIMELDPEGEVRVHTVWGNVPTAPLSMAFLRSLPADHPGWSCLPKELADRVADLGLSGTALPIRGNERLFGLLIAYAAAPLDTEAVFFLRSVANVLAVALERLYAEQERHQIETQMLQAQKLESLGLLAGGIAHDFNNLLTGIMGHTSLALLDLHPNHELQPHLVAIDQAAQRAAELCSQLLAYAGRGQRSLEAVNLSTLVREMGGILHLPNHRSGNVTIHYDLATDLPSVVVEASQIRQVVLNLLTNAIEAIGDRGGSVTLRTGVVTLSATDLRRLNLTPTIPPGRYVTLTVSDTGIGMDEVTMRRIFDPFFSTKPKGHGLGLAAVQGIVRRHHGAIKVESTPGLGSSFTIYLPAAGKEVAVGPVTVTKPITLQGTALIVDDDVAVRTTLRRILERAGMVTIEAGDGRSALTLLTESTLPITIALVDLAMPGMNGLELLDAIRRHEPQLPVLLMSGNAEQVVTGKLPSDRYTDFLPKPYRSHDLLTKISQLIQNATRSIPLG